MDSSRRLREIKKTEKRRDRERRDSESGSAVLRSRDQPYIASDQLLRDEDRQKEKPTFG